MLYAIFHFRCLPHYFISLAGAAVFNTNAADDCLRFMIIYEPVHEYAHGYTPPRHAALPLNAAMLDRATLA